MFTFDNVWNFDEIGVTAKAVLRSDDVTYIVEFNESYVSVHLLVRRPAHGIVGGHVTRWAKPAIRGNQK